MSVEDQIVELTKQLVSIPSYENENEIAYYLKNHLEEFGFNPELIPLDLEHPSLICRVEKPSAKKTIWFECSLDTASPGDLLSWKYNPMVPTLIGNNLYGLGVADSKIAIAMFCQLAKDLANNADFNGNIFLGFDSQEQNGKFSGIREILRYAPKADVCVLGYQDFEEIHIGARGWLRLKVTVHGQGAHTGSRFNKGINAIHKMHKAVKEILSIEFVNDVEPFFEFGSKINVVDIRGGQAINLVPNKCEVIIDVRTTPKTQASSVLTHMEKVLNRINSKDRDFVFELEALQAEAAYLSNPNDPFIQILRQNYEQKTGRKAKLVASGPGSVGNIISEQNIPIINSFGVMSGDVHSPREFINITTIQPVYEIWKQTLIDYCKT
jgi:acetylornithine deacetylase/succinyl-diaminopimelate desuccinylase-like protein